MKHISPDHLVTLGCFFVEEILPIIIKAQIKCHNRMRYKLTIHNGNIYRPKISSKRLQCFAQNICCVNCGVKGEIFLLQMQKGVGRPHLNLYAVQNDSLVLMTQDHKIPRSRGGPNTLNNLQTMCYSCNQEKSDKIVSPET